MADNIEFLAFADSYRFFVGFSIDSRANDNLKQRDKMEFTFVFVEKTTVFVHFTLICKIDKLGIEIVPPFVYNVFIAVLGTVNHRKEIYTYVHS